MRIKIWNDIEKGDGGATPAALYEWYLESKKHRKRQQNKLKYLVGNR